MSSLAISLVTAPRVVQRLDEAMHDVEKAAEVIRATIVRERAVVKFYLAIRGLNSTIAEFLATLDESVRDLQAGKFVSPQPIAGDEEIDPVDIVKRMEMVYGLLAGLHHFAIAAGLKNKLLTKRQVQSLHDLAEHLHDYITWLNDVTTAEKRAEVEAHFEQATQELEAGDTVAFM